MLEEFLSTVNHGDYISDYWLFEDDYVKEVRYENNTTETYITEISDFVEDNPNHQIIDKLKEYKEF